MPDVLTEDSTAQRRSDVAQTELFFCTHQSGKSRIEYHTLSIIIHTRQRSSVSVQLSTGLPLSVFCHSLDRSTYSYKGIFVVQHA